MATAGGIFRGRPSYLARGLAEVTLAVEFTAQPVGGGAPVRFAQIAEIGENIYRPLLDGPWEGNDARDVVSEAREEIA